MMHQDHARDFAAFCAANPVSCPLIAQVPAGERMAPADLAADCDLTTDLRSYDVLRFGAKTESRDQVKDLFDDQMASFLIGSSVSFDGLLTERNWHPGWGPCIYLTTRMCTPVGPFAGPMAVTMRTFTPAIAEQVAEFTSHFPDCHGGPIAIDDPASLGITDETDQFLPWPGPMPPDQRKLYWACGITPSLVAVAARLPLMIVHTPATPWSRTSRPWTSIDPEVEY